MLGNRITVGGSAGALHVFRTASKGKAAPFAYGRYYAGGSSRSNEYRCNGFDRYSHMTIRSLSHFEKRPVTISFSVSEKVKAHFSSLTGSDSTKPSILTKHFISIKVKHFVTSMGGKRPGLIVFDLGKKHLLTLQTLKFLTYL